MSSRDRHNRHHGNGGKRNDNRRNENRYNNEPRRDDFSYSFLPKRSLFRPTQTVTQEQIRKDEEAIRVFKNENQLTCPRCGKTITDLSSAVTSKGGGEPLHFDCALEILSEEETLAPGDKIAYIGQGRFGIISYPVPQDLKHFTIKKIIEWEDKDKKPHWRDTLAELYSHVK